MTRPALIAALLLVSACDKNKSEAAQPPEATPAEPAAEEVPEKHLDVSADKSGALARAAAVLEADGIDSADLQVLSHHAERLPTASTVCKHMMDVRGSTGGIKDCVEQVEHHVAQLGPELWAAASACFMESTTPAHLDACAAAEEEAEKLLHDNPHGEGLDQKTCDTFFDKFVKLAAADAKDDAAHVEQVLGTVRDDIVRSCMEQSTKAEMECSEKANTLHELEECAKDLV